MPATQPASDDADYVFKNNSSSALKKTKSQTPKSCQSRCFHHRIYSNSEEDDNNSASVENDSATMLPLKPDYEGLLESDDLPNRRGSSNSNTG